MCGAYRAPDAIDRSGAVPPLSALGDWTLDPVALLVAALGVVLYLRGVGTARRRGAWPARRTAAFLLLGVGSYLLVCLGPLGALSSGLRWAFVLRVTLLLLLVPALVALGRPVELLAAALGDRGRARLDRLRASRPIRLLGTAIVAPIVPFVVFLLLLTPIAGAVRVSPLGSAAVSLLVPALGLLLTLSLVQEQAQRTGASYTGEFLIGFVELVLDAIPGILMRLSGTVLDGLPHLAVGAAAWFPSPLRDQQLAGDLLWCVAELGDVPALILLFARWQRSDRREARSYDDLTDEEYAALAAEHLRGRRDEA